MRLLIIGGTKFVGRHLTEAAIGAGHEVTLFNRGETNPGLFPDVAHIRGDRDGGLAALGDGSWDAVLDTCGYVPRVVRDSSQQLRQCAGLYAFVSSLSVYPDESPPGYDETAQVHAPPADPTTEDVNEETYGPLKVLCEREVLSALGDRGLILRCGLIVGPHDPTDRFTYWVRRVGAGGEVLTPAPPDCPVQFIDARDLAAWTVRMIQAGEAGVYNATGPDYPLTMERFLEACREATGAEARFTWVSEDFLRDGGVEPWGEIPLWLPGEEYEGFMQASVGKATGAGLGFRPLGETIADTAAWDGTRPPGRPMKAGLDPTREAELLAAWHPSAGD